MGEFGRKRVKDRHASIQPASPHLASASASDTNMGRQAKRTKIRPRECKSPLNTNRTSERGICLSFRKPLLTTNRRCLDRYIIILLHVSFGLLIWVVIPSPTTSAGPPLIIGITDMGERRRSLVSLLIFSEASTLIPFMSLFFPALCCVCLVDDASHS